MITETQGRIIVANKKYVHELIHKFLSDFRNTQKILVNVEARFLQLRQADFSEVGVDWTGINPFYSYWADQALSGDYGDMRGIHTLFTQADRAQGLAVQTPTATDPPVPGLNTHSRTIAFPAENQGQPITFSKYAVVGSMVNSSINYANSIDAASQAITGRQATSATSWNNRLYGGINGQVSNSGFHGQITFMDRIQTQMVIRAVQIGRASCRERV